MIKNFKKGISIGRKQIGIALIIYAIQFLLALPFALQIFRVLHASIGDSLEVQRLVGVFDNTIFSDFLNHHGASITPLIGQLRWIVVIYLFAWIFFNGGIMHCMKIGTNSFEEFWRGCGRYFWRLMKVSLFFILLMFVWAMVVFIPLAGLFERALNVLPSEKQFVFIGTGALILFMSGFFVLLILSIVAKVWTVKNDVYGVMKAVKFSFGWLKRNFLKALGLLLLFGLLQALVFLFYSFADKTTGMVTIFLIFLFFILQQLLILAKIVIRIMLIGAFYSAIPEETGHEEIVT